MWLKSTAAAAAVIDGYCLLVIDNHTHTHALVGFNQADKLIQNRNISLAFFRKHWMIGIFLLFCFCLK